MNRRSFLALVTTAPIIAPEPVRRYFFAPAGGWLGARSIVPPWIAGPVYSCADVVLTFRDEGGRRIVITPADLHGMAWRRP